MGGLGGGAMKKTWWTAEPIHFAILADLIQDDKNKKLFQDLFQDQEQMA